MTKKKKSKKKKILYKSEKKVLGGVLGGLAEYFGQDPNLFRLGWLASFLFVGKWLEHIIFYILAWIFIPSRKTRCKDGSKRK